jgi:hypothetical protein
MQKFIKGRKVKYIRVSDYGRGCHLQIGKIYIIQNGETAENKDWINIIGHDRYWVETKCFSLISEKSDIKQYGIVSFCKKYYK